MTTKKPLAGTTAKLVERAMQKTHHEVYQALGQATMMLRKKKQKENPPRASKKKKKKDKRSPNFTKRHKSAIKINE